MTQQVILFRGPDGGFWVTDGTVAGTYEAAAVRSAEWFVGLNGEVLFQGNASLWVSGGTGAGSYQLTGINGAYQNGFSPLNFTAVNNKVVFSAYNTNDIIGLWVTDGTATGTQELTVNGAWQNGLSPYFFTTLNSTQVIFAGTDSNVQSGLWVTDGTSVGMRLALLLRCEQAQRA